MILPPHITSILAALRAALPLLLFLAGVFCGWQSKGWQAGAQEQKQAAGGMVQTLKVERQQTKTATAAAAENAQQRAQDTEQQSTVVREVIRYVQSPDSGHCQLPADWVRIHDQATGLSGAAPGGSLPTAAGTPAAGPVTDADALPVITDNYAICQDEITRLQGWQDWYRSLSNAPQ